MEALDETFRIGRELGIPVVVSHHKVQNKPNFGRSKETLRLHPRDDEAASAVCLDCYPYTAGSTMIRTDRGMLDGRVLIASSVPHPEMRRPRPRRDRRRVGRRRRARRRDACSPAPRSTS